MDEQNLEDLNKRLVEARTHTSDASARLNRIESIIRSWTPNGPSTTAYWDKFFIIKWAGVVQW